MFRVGSVTVLATTLNVVGAVEEEEDKAPELFQQLTKCTELAYIENLSLNDMYLYVIRI